MNAQDRRAAQERIANYDLLHQQLEAVNIALRDVMSISGNHGENPKLGFIQMLVPNAVATFKSLDVRSIEVTPHMLRVFLQPLLEARRDALKKQIEEL